MKHPLAPNSTPPTKNTPKDRIPPQVTNEGTLVTSLVSRCSFLFSIPSELDFLTAFFVYMYTFNNILSSLLLSVNFH